MYLTSSLTFQPILLLFVACRLGAGAVKQHNSEEVICCRLWTYKGFDYMYSQNCIIAVSGYVWTSRIKVWALLSHPSLNYCNDGVVDCAVYAKCLLKLPVKWVDALLTELLLLYPFDNIIDMQHRKQYTTERYGAIANKK